MILALDLGTRTGWALASPQSEGDPCSGVEILKNDRYSGGGMRYLRFKRFLDELYATSSFKEVVFEEVRRHRGTDAAHVYGGVLAMLTSWCEEKNIPYEGVPVGTIKKFWTGKGNAPKEAMIAEAVKRGFTPQDDNEADALAILHYRLNSLPSKAQDGNQDGRTIRLSEIWE